MSASSIIKRALADGVRIALSHVGTLKISGEPANVSRWADVVRSHKGEIVDALSILELARGDYFTHKDTCPICAISWAATASCEEHGELWLAYHDALVAVHGPDLVNEPPTPEPTREVPEAAKAVSSGYGTVPTAQIRPPSWHRARDAYHSHLVACDTCKPSMLCDEGRQLKREYELITQDTQSG